MTSVPDRQFLERAFALADLDAVRVALFQQTGDPELAALPLAAAMARAERSLLVNKAIAWLAENLGPRTLAEPAELELRELMTLATGKPMGDLEFQARRDLPAFKPFPYAVHWPGEKPRIPEGFKVAIIGSGFAGLAMAVQLDVLGIPYFILERRADPGGVWNINRYPDVRVDTSSITYEFPFMKNYAWSEYFARGSEVRNYVRHVSEQFGVHPNIRFDHDMKRAHFDQACNLWVLEVETPDGMETMRANMLISAAGLYTTPNLPPFPGAESFEGEIVHPSRWPADLDLAGKRVATIGNGSTGVQLLSAVAREAAFVSVFQRTPQWISPRDNYGKPVEPEIAWLLKYFPGYWNWWRFTATAPLFDTHGLMLTDTQWQAGGGKVNPRNDAMRTVLTNYIHEQTGGRQDLIDKLIPDYAPFSRRPVVDNGWYRALTRENVELVTDVIARFTREGIETVDGKLRKVDMVVAATGFEVVKYLWPAKLTGKSGIDLHESWASADGPRAYIGMMVPNFPNFFMLYGPNSQPVSGGPAQPVWFAIWAGYVGRCLMRVIEQGKASIEVRQAGFERYNAELDEAAAKLVQMSKAGGIERNYYVNSEHRRLQVNAPWYSPDYYRMCSEVAWHELEVG